MPEELQKPLWPATFDVDHNLNPVIGNTPETEFITLTKVFDRLGFRALAGNLPITRLYRQVGITSGLAVIRIGRKLGSDEFRL